MTLKPPIVLANSSNITDIVRWMQDIKDENQFFAICVEIDVLISKNKVTFSPEEKQVINELFSILQNRRIENRIKTLYSSYETVMEGNFRILEHVNESFRKLILKRYSNTSEQSPAILIEIQDISKKYELSSDQKDIASYLKSKDVSRQYKVDIGYLYGQLKQADKIKDDENIKKIFRVLDSVQHIVERYKVLPQFSTLFERLNGSIDDADIGELTEQKAFAYAQQHISVHSGWLQNQFIGEKKHECDLLATTYHLSHSTVYTILVTIFLILFLILFKNLCMYAILILPGFLIAITVLYSNQILVTKIVHVGEVKSSFDDYPRAVEQLAIRAAAMQYPAQQYVFIGHPKRYDGGCSSVRCRVAAMLLNTYHIPTFKEMVLESCSIELPIKEKDIIQSIHKSMQYQFKISSYDAYIQFTTEGGKTIFI